MKKPKFIHGTAYVGEYITGMLLEAFVSRDRRVSKYFNLEKYSEDKELSLEDLLKCLEALNIRLYYKEENITEFMISVPDLLEYFKNLPFKEFPSIQERLNDIADQIINLYDHTKVPLRLFDEKFVSTLTYCGWNPSSMEGGAKYKPIKKEKNNVNS